MDQKKIEIKTTPLDRTSAESFKALRTNLLYISGLQVIALTSTQKDEGKSVTSFQLARTFASLNKKTLFIDCDLRRSTLKQYLQVRGNIDGLSEALTWKQRDVVHETDIPHLSIVFSGKFPPNPSELLSGNGFPTLLDEYRKEFDYIFIDTPPMMGAIDASIISRYVDGTLLVVRSDFSKRMQVVKAKQQVERNGGKVIGCILNRVDKYQKDYYYGYYYGEDE